MRKALTWLFPIAAIAICLIPFRDAVALDTSVMAECKDGVCTLSEKDWNRLREFHRKVATAAVKLDDQTIRINEMNGELMGQVARCKAQLERRAI